MITSWQPSASIASLKARARIMADIRAFFTKRGYLEVETPVLGRFGTTDVHLSNLTATFRGKPYYLQTSPEYHMKRLLAAGSGAIFQIARVFRDDELGRWHNPEFTLLEWYQLDIDHHALMAEIDTFLQEIVHAPPLIKKTYQQAFVEACDIDPFGCSLLQLQNTAKQFDLGNVFSADETNPDLYLFLLMSHVVEPFLAKEQSPIAIYDFPASQASLAQIKDNKAARFEVYYQGIELANGFHELTDATIQRQRFNQDNEIRQQQGVAPAPIDEYLLQALEHGLPPCSGVALGVERLLALAWQHRCIEQTLAFDISRA